MNKYYISILALLFLVGACSETEPDLREEIGKEELAINAGIVTSVKAESRTTRADGDLAFIKPFDLFVNQTAPASFVTHTKFDAEYDSKLGCFSVYSGTKANTWYWDDKGGVKASINLIGIYPKGVTTSVENTFPWSVVIAQTADKDSIASDLLISKKVADYKLSTQRSKKAEIEFHHVFSKLTFKLKKGTGFKEDGSDFNPEIETVSLLTNADITIGTDGAVTIENKGEKAAMTPHLITKNATTNEQVLAAIVLPKQTIKKGESFATIKVELNGAINDYPVVLSADKDDITFESGKNYVFEITLNKTGALVSATIVDWDNTPDKVEEEVKITVGGNTLLTDAKINDGAFLYIKVLSGNTPKEITSLRSKTIYNKTLTKWGNLDPVLYWDDIPTGKDNKTYASAILYNEENGSISNISNNPDYIYQGNSQALEEAKTYLQFKDMVHPFSKVHVKIRTEKDAPDKVDLTKLINLRFNKKIKQFKSIDIKSDATESSHVITYCSNEGADLSDVDLENKIIPSMFEDGKGKETEGEDPNKKTYEFYKLDPIYIEPVQITGSGDDKELMRLFYKDGDVKNEYPLTDIAVNFEKNKEYTIVVTLSKTEIAKVGVTIKPWDETSSIGGNAGIDQ